MSLKRLTIVIACMGLLLSPVIFAQSGADEFIPNSMSHFRFNFINPGARATAMGGAFIAQGNDATGSETNPAGLLFIPRPMVFAEYRFFRYTADRAYSATDTAVLNRKFTDDVNSLTFVSIVFPMKNWAFAIYRQELANFKAHYSSESFLVPNPPPNTIVWTWNRQAIDLDFKLVNYGFTVARRLHETLAVGASVRIAHMSFGGNELVNFNDPPPLIDPLVSADSANNIGNYWHMGDSDNKVSFTAGLQFKPNDYLSIGAVYRYGAKHELKTTFMGNVRYFDPSTGDYVYLAQTYNNFKIDVPDRFGVGVSLTPTDRFTLNMDVVRITYTDLNDQFRAVLNQSYSESPFTDPADDPARYFGWKDGTEFRIGGEYVFPFGRTDSLALRAGYYRAPDPSIHYLGGAPAASALLYNITFPPLKVDHHATFGLGMVIFRNLQIDLAGDLARDRDCFAVSVMYNFGR